MNEALFIDDAVTGNGSGSYFFDARKAADVASGLVFDDDFKADARAAGYGPELFTEGQEAVDVVARCFALGLVSGSLMWQHFFEQIYERIRPASLNSTGLM